jgi:legumain
MKYRKLVIYVEACFAGSVFETVQLPKNVIAVTASNASESSWGTFCPTPKHPDADAINGIHIGTCLGDLFEVSWKRDLENRLSTGLMTNSTLTDHIEAVKDIVSRKSNVMVYGDTELLNEPLSNIFPLTCRTNSHKIQPSDDLLVESSMRQREPSFATPPVVLDYTLVAN